jgi:acetyl esterase/lipase
LNDAGIATWNIEYRRIGNPGGGWPGTFQDMAHAADFVRSLARENQLDLTRVIAIGHSVEGTLRCGWPHDPGWRRTVICMRRIHYDCQRC